jgi:ribosomal protein S18 acetylase RimI-like enzyme
MQIIHTHIDDIATIFEIYDHAIAHQKAVSHLAWDGFSEEMVRQEISEKRHYKIVVDEQIAATFILTYNDDLIWGARPAKKAIYLHRAATHNAFRGSNFIKAMLEYTIAHAQKNKIPYFRLDTWQDNPKLHGIYLNNGFTYMGTQITPETPLLPKHYWGTVLGLFEMEV